MFGVAYKEIDNLSNHSCKKSVSMKHLQQSTGQLRLSKLFFFNIVWLSLCDSCQVCVCVCLYETSVTENGNDLLAFILSTFIPLRAGRKLGAAIDMSKYTPYDRS
jgi:hypothetical protein